MPSTATSRRPIHDSRSALPAPALSFAEQVCLALIVEGVSHGWALGSLLAPDGDLGRIWSLTRPLTYRAIDGLVAKGLVIRRGHTTGHGRDRVLLAPTAAGRRSAREWLDTPVRHLRDVRTELLLKLALRQRVGLDIQTLLAAQQGVLQPTIDGLTSRADDGGLVELWRRENARAVRRFLDQAIHPVDVPVPAKPEMRLSARNQLPATIVTVSHGEVMSTVKAVLSDGHSLTAVITKDAAEDLDLAPGDAVLMVVKSTEVMVAKAS